MVETNLATLRAGTWALVTGFDAGDEDSLRKLLALGLAPGDRVHVHATWPVVVLEYGASSYAIDHELARCVHVVIDSPAPL